MAVCMCAKDFYQEPLMSRQVFGLLLLIAWGMAGCATQDQTPAQPIAPDDMLTVRADYMRANPNARVGLVTSVIPSRQQLTVGYTRLGDFSVNDVVTIVDSNHRLITNGLITSIRDEIITVKYQPAAGNAPQPMDGDLAISIQK